MDVLEDKKKEVRQREAKKEYLEKKIKKIASLKADKDGNLTKEGETSLQTKMVISGIKSEAAENKSMNSVS